MLVIGLTGLAMLAFAANSVLCSQRNDGVGVVDRGPPRVAD